MGYSLNDLAIMLGQEKAKEIFNSLKVNIDSYCQGPSVSESIHGENLASALEDMGVRFAHIANETGQKMTKNIIISHNKKKKQGLSKGFPDYVILYPYKEGTVQIFLELKKEKTKNGGNNGSVLSLEQHKWLTSLQQCLCNFCIVGYGMVDSLNKIGIIIQGIENEGIINYYEKHKKDFLDTIKRTPAKESTYINGKPKSKMIYIL